MNRLAIVLAAVAAVSPAFGQQRVDEKRPAAKDGVVEIRNVSGSVTVMGWDRDEVAVTGTLGRGTDRLDFAASGSTTRIKVVLPEHSQKVDGSDLEIHVPAASRLEINTVSADIDVDRVSGTLRLEAVSGRVKVGGNPREVEVKTVSGEVDVAAVSAPVRANSVSGSLTLSGLTGRVEASTVSGSVMVKGGQVADAEFQTVSGGISFDGDLTKDGRLRAKSMSGTVELLLSPDTPTDFEVTTFSGRIENQLGPAPRRNEDGPGRDLSFSTGPGGGARVVVSSFSGTVRLRKR